MTAVFVDSSGRARFVLLAAVASAISCLGLLAAAEKAAAATVSAADEQWLYLQYSLDFAALAIVVYFLGFLAWAYRAYKNLPALSGTRTNWHSGWIFASWVIPIANLFFPCLLLWETGRRSAGAAGLKGNWRRSLILWWVLFLFDAGLLDAYWRLIASVGIHAPPAVSAAALGPQMTGIVFAHMLFSVEGFFACWLIFTVVDMQRRLHASPPPAPVANTKNYY